MTSAPTTAAASRGAELRLPSYPWRFAHLAALWGFGVSQPVFSMLKGNPEFLVVRGSSRADVVLFALLLAFAAPLLVVLAEAIVGLVWPLLSRALHVAAVWCFGFLAVLQLVRMTEPENGAALLLPLLPAAALAFAYMRWNAFRSILSISLALPVLGVLAFVATVPLAVDDAEGADVVVPSRTPVVLVVLDELPTSSLLRADGTLDARRYPNFARLAGDGTWYPRATTVHEFTTQAVPAILTGNTPKQDELPTLKDHPRNLFTLLGERYAFEVVEPVTRLCPARYCPETRVRAAWADRYRGLFYDVGVAYLYRVLPSSLRVELPPIGDRWGGFGTGTRERLLGALDTHDVNLALESEDHQPRTEFEQFLAGIRRGEPRRTLHFLHVKLPHTPFRLLPSGREYGNAISVDGIHTDAFNDWAGSQVLVNQALQRHLLQLGYTDRLLGVLLDRLEETGVYDRALVIVTADHGSSFVAGGDRRFVDGENTADIAGVPLLVKYPGRPGGRIDTRDARTTDILPTIAEVLGVDLPWRVDGRSLLGPPATRRVFVGSRFSAPHITDPDDVHAGVLATARRNAESFGEGADSLYRIGPFRQLLGRRIDGARSSPVTVRIDGEYLYADVRPASGFVPARIVGELVGRPVEGLSLAIAVNGRIAATTQTYVRDGKAYFAALVPETSFREGRNDVDILSIGSADGLRLTRLGGTGRGGSYALSPDGRRLVLPSGRQVALTNGRLAGRVESSTVEGVAVRIQGWAADVQDRARVDRVLIFAGPRLLYAADTAAYRLDITGVSSVSGLQRIGFLAELPLRDVRDATLRAIAVRGALASELEWPRRATELASASHEGE
jgi:hypothetical protein